MELSHFLAKLFGIYLLGMGVLWILRGRVIAASVEEFFANRGMLFLSGLIALAAGIAIAVGHPVWEWSWRGAITVIGYLSIAKGVVRIAFPDAPQRAALATLVKGNGRWAMIALALLLGAWLTWRGFGG